MRPTKLCFAVLLLLAGQSATAQDDLIDDLPRARKEAAAAFAAQSKAKKTKNEPQAADPLPAVKQPNEDLIDDLSPEQKRSAAERTVARKIENAIPDNLAEALARALQNSPAILVAEAKVRQTQAELNEVRQTVVHDLTLAFKRRARNKDLLPQGSEDVREAVLEDEAKILYLLGVVGEARIAFDFQRDYTVAAGLPEIAGDKSAEVTRKPGKAAAEKASQGNAQAMSPSGMMSAMMMGMGAAPQTATESRSLKELPENVRSFLSKRIDLDFAEQPLKDVLDYIKQAGGDEVDFVLQNPEEWAIDPSGADTPHDWVVSIAIKRVTVAAALQALADLKGCAFVFRDYGILVTAPGADGYLLESYRASGSPMIAPPSLQIGGIGGMGAGVGMPNAMGGMMMGPAPQPGNPPANPAAEQ